jgi:SAM-dependent methyltransferase
MSEVTLSTAERLGTLLDHLGIGQAHVAACMSGDWGQLISNNQERVSSLTVIAPHLNKGIPAGIENFAGPSLVISGDQGASAKQAQALADKLPGSELYSLRDYTSPMWADTVADRQEDVAKGLTDFLERAQQSGNLSDVSPEKGAGECAGLRYNVSGMGPPIVLFPLSLAPSQWAPLVGELAKEFCVIVLGGARIGAVSLLEARAKSGYGQLLSELVDQADINAGETVLEVGCGSGALARHIGRTTGGQNPIVATDLNPYLLSEAKNLASDDSLMDVVSFREANAEALPFPDASFDVSFSCTVMEEGDANRMMSELARVTKPDGRIVAVVRATDVDWWVNVPLPHDERRKLGTFGPQTGAGVGRGGCASSDLYERLIRAGMSLETFGPRFAFYQDGERLDDVLDRLAGVFASSDVKQFRQAVGQAAKQGVLSVGEPFHCSIATR